MFGREEQLKQLVAASERALRDERTVVLVEGPIGIGKTALISEATRGSPGEIIRNQAGAAHGEFPLEGLRYLVERVFEQPLDAVLDRVSLYEIARCCIQFLSDSPATLVIDDVHWIDDSSRALLERILVAPIRHGLIVLAHRPGQLPRAISEALRRTGVRVESILVPPLGDRQIQAMLHHLDDSSARAVVAHAAGNPLFARLLGNAAQARPGNLERMLEPRPHREALTLFSTVRDDIEALPEAQRLVAQALAVANSTQLPLIEAITGLSGDEVSRALTELRRTQILDRTEGLEVMHPVIRNAAYDAATAEWIVAAHRTAAAFSDGLEAVEHLSRLGRNQTPDEAAAVVAQAETVVGTAPANAVQWLRSTRHIADVRRDVLLARALVVSGAPHEAVRLLRPLAEHPGHRAEARQLLAHALRMLGNTTEAHDILQASRDLEDPALQIERITLALMCEDQYPVSIDLGALDIATIDDNVAVGIRSLHSLALLNAGDVIGARREFDGVADRMLLMPAADLRDIIDTVSVAGWCACILDQPELAVRLAQRGIRVADRYGRSHVLAHLKTQLAFALIHCGRLIEPDAAADDAIADAERYSTADVAPMAWAAKLLSADWRKDRSQVLDALAAIAAEPPTTVAWWRRTVESAVVRISKRYGLEVASFTPDDTGDAMSPLRHLDYAAVAMLDGELDLAAVRFARARREAERTGLQSHQALVGMFEAKYRAQIEGPTPRLIAQVSAAADAFEQLGMPHRRTMALEIEAELRRLAAQDVRSVLTSRESEIATLVSSGLSNQQIAARLGISRRTVEEHVSNVLSKLEVPSRAAVGQALAR